MTSIEVYDSDVENLARRLVLAVYTIDTTDQKFIMTDATKIIHEWMEATLVGHAPPPPAATGGVWVTADHLAVHKSVCDELVEARKERAKLQAEVRLLEEINANQRAWVQDAWAERDAAKLALNDMRAALRKLL